MMRLLVALLLVLSVSPAFARWKAEYALASPEIREWFRNQHDRRGNWCCDEADGSRYDGDYKLNGDGSVTLADGRRVEAEKVLTGPNPTGHAVLWHYGKVIYCFAPGTLF